MKKVSAIITTHNRSYLLKRAIESVLNQTYSYMECIVVDDNSTDNTREVCNLYPIKYIYIPKEESHGGNYARNLGIKNASGEYCAFLDDDDYWMPTKIEKQVELLEKKKCECVYCLRLMENIQNGSVVSQKNEGLTYKYEGNISKKIFRHTITSTSCILATKRILDQIEGFDEKLFKMQEYDLLIRISQLSHIYYCHGEPLVCFTNNQDDGNRISIDPTRLPVAKKYIENKHRLLLKNAGLCNRFLHMDWMNSALYFTAIRANNKRDQIKYGFYYYFMSPIRFFISVIIKLSNLKI